MKRFIKLFDFQLLLWIVIVIYLGIILFPLVQLFLTSLKTQKDVYRLPITWLPKEKIYLKNYSKAFLRRNFSRYTINSVMIVTGVLAICLTFGSLAAYGFARFKFPGQNLLLLLIIGARFIAPVALVVPFFVLAFRVGLYNTHIALILANTYMNLPFFIIILKQSMGQIPESILDSAKVDGCSELGVFFRIALPLSKPGLVAGSIFAFIFTWNEFLFASTLTSTDFAKPLTVGITEFIGDRTIDWGALSAGGIISMIPTFIFILLFQKYIVRGILAGAVKK